MIVKQQHQAAAAASSSAATHKHEQQSHQHHLHRLEQQQHLVYKHEQPFRGGSSLVKQEYGDPSVRHQFAVEQHQLRQLQQQQFVAPKQEFPRYQFEVSQFRADPYAAAGTSGGSRYTGGTAVEERLVDEHRRAPAVPDGDNLDGTKIVPKVEDYSVMKVSSTTGPESIGRN